MRKVPFKGSPKYYLGNTSTCDLLPSAGCPLKSLFALNPTWRFMGSYTRGYMSHKMPTHATTCRHAQTRNVPTQAAIPKGRKMCMATYAQTRKKCARAISGERKESSEREREGVQKHDDMPELEMLPTRMPTCDVSLLQSLSQIATPQAFATMGSLRSDCFVFAAHLLKALKPEMLNADNPRRETPQL